MTDRAPAGWVVRVVINASCNPPLVSLYDVACPDPTDAIKRARYVSGASDTAPVQLIRPLSKSDVAGLGLMQEQVRTHDGGVT